MQLLLKVTHPVATLCSVGTYQNRPELGRRQ